MSERIDVMISSTARDLPDHREAAMKAILSLGLHPIMMEHLPASPNDAIDESMRLVNEAEYYVGIFAHRYGYIPLDPTRNPTAISITEMEYRRAIERKIPVYIFVIDPKHPVLIEDVEGEPGAGKLKNFRDHLTTTHVVKFFVSSADLEAKISQTLAGIPKPQNGKYSPAPPPDVHVLADHGDLPPRSRLPFPQNEYFVGREKDLLAIWQVLYPTPTPNPDPSHGAKKHAMAITATGTGGIGKSQLAVEFAYRYGRFFHGVHWLSAQTDNIAGAIAACGYPDHMNLPDFPNEQAAQIQRVLAEWNQAAPRLLIVDNAENPAALQEWLPRLQGQRVLITSRRTTWPKEWGITNHRLEVLTPAESRTLLRKLAPHLDDVPDAELDTVGEKLGYLPLALDLAGRYMDGRTVDDAPMTPAQYVARLDKQKSLLDHTSLTTWAKELGIVNPTDHDMNLYANFDLSWQRLTSDAAKRLLMGCGYLAPNSPIPLELLAALFQNDDDPEDTRDMALGQLENVGLLSRKADEGTTIHPLIADFARSQTPLATQWGGVGGGDVLAVLARKMARMSKEANDTGIPANFTPLRAHVERLAEHAEQAGNEDAGSLWINHGYHLQHMIADYAGARAAYERALRIDENALGPEHPTVAIRVNNLGNLLREMGDYAGATDYLERALRIDEQEYGPEHPNVAIRVNNLGLVLQAQGDMAGAKAMYERALWIGEATLGPEHPDVAVWVNNLGGVLRAQGDLAGAQAMYERALRIDENALGPEHPNVAIRVNNLGSVLQDMGDLGGAKGMYERALRIWEATLGAGHPQVAVGSNNLGLVLQDMGDLAGAQAMHERALRIWEAKLGSEHPNVAYGLWNLGAVYYYMGELATAKAHLERALRIFQRFLPAGHPYIAGVQSWLDKVNRKLAGGG